MIPFLILALAAQDAAQWSAQKPPALLAFEQARKAIVYADFSWSRTKPLAPGIQGGEWFFESRIAGDDISMIGLGRSDGIAQLRDVDGGFEPGKHPNATLHNSDSGDWMYNVDDILAYQWPDSGGLHSVQVASAGMMPNLNNYPPEEQIDKTLHRIFKGPPRFREEHEGGIVRVRARCDNTPRYEYVWTIDPALNWNATSVEVLSDGVMDVRAETEYEEINGVYVPVSTALINSKGDVFALDTVYRAEVNTPDLPHELLPEHIGIEPGVIVNIQDTTGAEQLAYAGDNKTMPAGKFFSKAHRGEVEFGPKMRAARAHQPIPWGVPGTEQVRREVEQLRRTRLEQQALDEWAKYTRDFIKRNQLDDEQTQKAIQILRSCQALRDHYLRGKKREIEALETKLAKAKDADKRAVKDSIQRLHAPVEHIFETNLKPRLDRLPTRRQKREANAKAKKASP